MWQSERLGLRAHLCVLHPFIILAHPLTPSLQTQVCLDAAAVAVVVDAGCAVMGGVASMSATKKAIKQQSQQVCVCILMHLFACCIV